MLKNSQTVLGHSQNGYILQPSFLNNRANPAVDGPTPQLTTQTTESMLTLLAVKEK